MWPLRIYWIKAPLLGRIAVMPRPHPAAFAELKSAGVDCVVSLLDSAEAEQLGLAREDQLAETAGMEFLHLPVVDHGIPADIAPVENITANIKARLAAGQGVAVHCYAGIGRSPLLIAAVMIDSGMDAYTACDLISDARGISVPEMAEQVEWLLQYELRRQR